MTLQPKFKVDLPGSQWCAVVTEDGSHFYHNNETRQSVWRADGDELKKAVKQVDCRVLLLLIAKSRGLKLDSAAEELINGAGAQAHVHVDRRDHQPAEELGESSGVTEHSTDAGPVVSLQPTREGALSKLTGLVSGYSSSEEDTDGDDDSVKGEDGIDGEFEQLNNQPEDHDPSTNSLQHSVNDSQLDNQSEDVPKNAELPDSDPEESSEDGNGFDFDQLDDISSDEEDSNKLSAEQAEASFLSLLQDSSLDPYSPWEIESLKIVHDSRFLDVDNNRDRKRLFDSWSTMSLTMTNDRLKSSPVTKESPFVQYMRFLETRECDRFYMDFKQKWKQDLDQIELSDREKEKIYKEYIIFGKKTIMEKENIFKSLLMGSKIFKKNLLSPSLNSRKVVDSVSIDSLDHLDEDKSYEKLHSIEEDLNISQSITSQTKYFLVDVKTRIRLIVQVSLLLLPN